MLWWNIFKIRKEEFNFWLVTLLIILGYCTNALTEECLQGEVPALNKQIHIMSWRRSTTQEVNDSYPIEAIEFKTNPKIHIVSTAKIVNNFLIQKFLLFFCKDFYQMWIQFCTKCCCFKIVFRVAEKNSNTWKIQRFSVKPQTVSHCR